MCAERPKLLRCVAMVALLAAFLVSCASPSPTPTPAAMKAATAESTKAAPTSMPEPDRIFRYGMWSSPKSFSPYATTDGYSGTVFDIIYGRLLGLDTEGNPEPFLAESWEVSPDGATWTFHIRENAVWSDGTPVTARDVEMSFRLHGHPDVGSVMYGKFKVIKGLEEYNAGEADKVEGLQIVDEKTIKFVLTGPNAAFYKTVIYFVLPSHILGDVPPDQLATHAYFQAPTVGVGAFNLVKYEPDQYIEFEANDSYFLGAPKIKRMIIRIGTQDVLLAQLQKDELDFTMVPPAEVDRVEKMDGVNVVSVPTGGAQLMMFNLNNSLLQDKRVRQAMAYALPREDIAEAIYLGAGTVQNSPNNMEWAVPSDLEPYEYDVDKAKALLTEAGWKPGTKLLFRYPTGNKPREMSAPLIQNALKAVGIETELRVTDFATLSADCNEGKFDLALMGWTGNSDPDSAASRMYHSESVPPSGSNRMRYANTEVDGLVEQGRSTFDQAARAEIYQALYRVLNDELPVLFLWSEDAIYGYNDRLQGFAPTRFGSKSTFSAAFPNIQELVLAED